MGIIADQRKLLQTLQQFVHEKPTWVRIYVLTRMNRRGDHRKELISLVVQGTCAGMILLSDRALHQKEGGQPLVGGLDVTIDRNHFGSQRNSFEIGLQVAEFGKLPFPAIFIRSPVIVEVGTKVDCVLAQLSDKAVVAVRQGHILGTSFHPELTADLRFHQYFVDMIKAHKDMAKRAPS